MFNNFKRKKINNRRFINKFNINNDKNEEPKEEEIIQQIKKTNPIIRIIKLLIWIIIIGSIFLYKSYYDFKTDILIEKETVIEIKSGDTIDDLSDKLNINKYYLKIYINKNKNDFKLLTGHFRIGKNTNINQILIDLQNPIIENNINITLLEGWNIYDIDNYLTNKQLIKKGEYINYVTNKEKIRQLSQFFPFLTGVETLEGYLYPDTYTVLSNNFKINKLVIKQLNNFEKKVYNKLFSNYKNNKVEEIINLASIVEKEEKNVNEKPTVAGILKKRMNNGWMIGADITVCYPHKLTANECKMVITKYINEKSEYNTRTMTGLPKTPIGNPSYETINATLNSKTSTHWFYLHDTKTGKIYYADTNQGHTINKNRYLR